MGIRKKITINNYKIPKQKIEWVNCINPEKKDIDFLSKKYNFDEKYLEKSLGKTIAERPEIKYEDKYIFLTLHFPIYKNNYIIAEEINFFIGHSFLITLHNNNLDILDNFFKKNKKTLLSYKQNSSSILLYEILEELVHHNYQVMDENNKDINKIEEMVFSGQGKMATYKILTLKRKIIEIRRIIQNHKNILKKLMYMESSIIPKQEIRKYYFPLVEDSKRIWEFSDNQKESIEAFKDTNKALRDNHMTNVMQTLTVFSGTIFPLSLVASLLSMNITGGMPLLNSKYGFYFIVIGMILIDIAALIFFKKKKWI